MPPVRMPLLSLTIAQLWLTNVEESTIEINAVFKCILYFKNNNTKCNNLSFTKSIAILDFFRCYTSVYIIQIYIYITYFIQAVPIDAAC